MPYDLKLVNQMSEAKTLIKQGEVGEASQVVESIYNYVERIWEAFNAFESLNILGTLASLLRALEQTDREIKVLERLCKVADDDLVKKGILAVDDDVRWTGMDFVYLGIAYRKRQRLVDARAALEKARYILEELGWECDVEKLLRGEATRIGPSDAVPKRSYPRKHDDTKKVDELYAILAGQAKKLEGSLFSNLPPNQDSCPIPSHRPEEETASESGSVLMRLARWVKRLFGF